MLFCFFFFFFQAEDGIRDGRVTGVQTCALPISVVDGDLPVMGPETLGLRFSMSPQTGGCESDRDSALGERLPGQYHECDASRQQCDCMNAHNSSGSHRVSCSRSHCALSCFMNATNSGSLRMRSRLGSLAK